MLKLMSSEKVSDLYLVNIWCENIDINLNFEKQSIL